MNDFLWNRMVAGAAGLLAALALTAPAAAQVAGPELFLVPAGDTVHVLVPNPPADLRGFVVYRAPAGDPLAQVTPSPVLPVRDPRALAAALGDDLPMVMRALRAADPAEVLPRLRAEPFAADVLSFLSHRVATALGRYYQDTGLTPGQEYEYRIAFTDARGEETGAGRIGRVRVADVTPGTPADPLAEARPDATVSLGWSYPAYAGAATDWVVGFHVYRRIGEGPELRLTDSPVLRNDAAPLLFVDHETAEGEPHQYWVRAVDLAGKQGPASPQVTVTPRDLRPPGIVVGLRAEADESRVHLLWRMSPEPDAAGYHVERSLGLDQPYERITADLIPVREPAWVDTTVTGGVQYIYRVVAVDLSGNESVPTNAVDAVPLDRTPPAPPTDVTAEAVDRRLVIRWTPSASGDVQGYHVYRGGGEDRLVRLTDRPLPATEFVDSGYADLGLAPGGAYLVSVSAVDHAWNESEPVTVDVSVPDDQPPAPPGGFLIRNVEGRYVELSWSASASLDVEAYLLHRERVASAGTPAEPPVLVARVPAHAPRAARDTTVTLNQSYVYRLIAVDSAGNESDAAVDSLRFRRFLPPPSPRFAAARVTDAGIEIRWERVAGRDLAGYHVYRARTPTGVPERVTTSPVQVLRFVDGSGRADHYYTVRAVDGGGNESSPSPAVRPRP